jgi:hypothetical protein
MKHTKFLLLADSIINFLLGIILLAYSKPVIQLFGLPGTENRFYPTILGAVLVGIGIALMIEYKRKGRFTGLGIGGAISINMTGGIVLLLWLLFGNLNIPVQGQIILWVLVFILIGISSLEFMSYLKHNTIRSVTPGE